jgi:prepilin-type processing-associated H-X9-DG protein
MIIRADIQARAMVTGLGMTRFQILSPRQKKNQNPLGAGIAVGNGAVLICPSDTISRGNYQTRSYSLNAGDGTGGWIGGVGNTTGVSLYASDINSASDLVLLTERANTNNRRGRKSNSHMGSALFHLGDAVHGRDFFYNTLFCDGHVEFIQRGQIHLKQEN